MEEGIKTAKKAAASMALRLISSGMHIGLGTGSTVAYLIEALGEQCRAGLILKALPTSEATEKLAKKYHIPLMDPETVTTLDLAIDGADEIDPLKRMIKGGGGALLREKIVAKMSRELIVIVDSSKQVTTLGAFPLPVEIVPFSFHATVAHLVALGFEGKLRTTQENSLFITDNGNYIYDIQLSFPCYEMEEDQRRIRSIPGVVETGFFIGIAGRVITGYPDGSVDIK